MTLEAATPSRWQAAVTEDFSTIAGAKTVANEVNKLGHFDAVIHNAGIGDRQVRAEAEPGVPRVFAVNVLAPTSDSADRKAGAVGLCQLRHGIGAYGRELTLCSGPSELGAARRLTPRASCAMCYSHLPLLGAGRTSDLRS
jgi:NAD(P)-dependent dehydrogenase (short-subunit alcohol dehydrogenase family)